MEKREILQRLNTDLNFAVQFMIDNNPNEIASRYETIMGKRANSKTQLYDDIIQLISQRNPKGFEITSVPYINGVSNYTGGLEADIMNTAPNFSSGQQNKAINWGNVFTTIGAIGTALGGTMTAQNSGSQYDPYALQRQMEEERRRQEEEEKRKRRTTAVVLISVGLLITGLIIFFAFGKKKP